MSKVRAKFFCAGANHRHVGGDGVFVEIDMHPIWEGPEGQNHTWSRATPQGKLTMCITNPDAAKAFEIGKCYYLDFTPAPDA